MIEEPHILIHDVYEPEVCNVIDRFVERGDCVVDVGACVGFFSERMSRLVGDEGLVVAFEPQMESYKHLLRNILVVHKLNNVACVKTAAWKCDDPELRLFSLPIVGYSSFHRYTTAYQPETVEGRSLDSWMAGNNHPRFIKIDCEGTELEVLLGARKMLERGVDCVVLELNYYIMGLTGRQDKDIRGYMAELGYDCFLINIGDGNGGYRAPVRVPPGQKIIVAHNSPGACYINVMFSTEEKVRERWNDYDRGQDALGAAADDRRGTGENGRQLQQAAQR
jgi:FkbM family methyltransferase